MWVPRPSRELTRSTVPRSKSISHINQPRFRAENVVRPTVRLSDEKQKENHEIRPIRQRRAFSPTRGREWVTKRRMRIRQKIKYSGEWPDSFFPGESAARRITRRCLRICEKKSVSQEKRRENARSLHSAATTTTTTGRPDDRRRDANRAESRDERVGESGFETVGAAKRVEQGAERGRRGERATRVELLDLPVDFFVIDRGGSGT